MKGYAPAFTLTLLALFLAGCGEDSNAVALKNYKRKPDTDISAEKRYNFASFAGSVWKTKDKIALASVGLYTGDQVTYVLPPIFFDATRSDYRPSDGNVRIGDVIPAGARLRVDRLMKDNGIGGLTFVIVDVTYGTTIRTNVFLSEAFIESGPTADFRIITTNWIVNAALLEEVKR